MIFLDANFLINFYIKTNKQHERANKIMKSIKGEELLISNLVIMEIITVMNVKLGQNQDTLFKVYNELNRDYKIIIDNDFYDNGFNMLINIFNEHKKRLPLFDCVYMAVMEKLKITKIVSFDEHFGLNKNIERID